MGSWDWPLLHLANPVIAKGSLEKNSIHCRVCRCKRVRNSQRHHPTHLFSLEAFWKAGNNIWHPTIEMARRNTADKSKQHLKLVATEAKKSTMEDTFSRYLQVGNAQKSLLVLIYLHTIPHHNSTFHYTTLDCITLHYIALDYVLLNHIVYYITYTALYYRRKFRN